MVAYPWVSSSGLRRRSGWNVSRSPSGPVSTMVMTQNISTGQPSSRRPPSGLLPVSLCFHYSNRCRLAPAPPRRRPRKRPSSATGRCAILRAGSGRGFALADASQSGRAVPRASTYAGRYRRTWSRPGECGRMNRGYSIMVSRRRALADGGQPVAITSRRTDRMRTMTINQEMGSQSWNTDGLERQA